MQKRKVFGFLKNIPLELYCFSGFRDNTLAGKENISGHQEYIDQEWTGVVGTLFQGCIMSVGSI